MSPWVLCNQILLGLKQRTLTRNPHKEMFSHWAFLKKTQQNAAIKSVHNLYIKSDPFSGLWHHFGQSLTVENRKAWDWIALLMWCKWVGYVTVKCIHGGIYTLTYYDETLTNQNSLNESIKLHNLSQEQTVEWRQEDCWDFFIFLIFMCSYTRRLLGLGFRWSQ